LAGEGEECRHGYRLQQQISSCTEGGIDDLPQLKTGFFGGPYQVDILVLFIISPMIIHEPYEIYSLESHSSFFAGQAWNTVIISENR